MASGEEGWDVEVGMDGGTKENIGDVMFRGPGPRNMTSAQVGVISGDEAGIHLGKHIFMPQQHGAWDPYSDDGRISRRFDGFSPWRPGAQHEASVSTMYKRKADKVRPVNMADPSGDNPGGVQDWEKRAMERRMRALEEKRLKRETGPFSAWITPKFSAMARGSRLHGERKAKLLVGEITPEERELLIEMLYNREEALAWTFDEMGQIHMDVAPPQKIRTIPHEAWQTPNFYCPRALIPKVTDMVRQRLERGTLEHCQGPYRNPWFLVKKKNGDYRMINAAMEINRVTIRDANLPPTVDAFSEEFAGMHVTSLIDFFSGYDQVGLDKASRDITAFMSPLGLVRQTTLPQGATNSVAQFVRIVMKILQGLIPEVAQPFVDDVAVKGPKTNYNNEMAAPGIRRYVLEHIQNLDKTLCALELAGATISGEKSQFCVGGLKLVGFLCDSQGRHPDATKVLKIIEWEDCRDVRSVRAFLGICVYYRIWVEHFAMVAAPLYSLLEKDAEFVWGQEQKDAMRHLKTVLTTAPALVTLDYSSEAGSIILAVDASLTGWGAVLMQMIDKKRHPVRYESGLWTDAEAKYDAGKRECRGLLKALKKLRHWLYGVHFVLELDANTLVAQLNQAATDVPGALVTRWLAWIRLFDFDVKHVAGRKHSAADGLSRRPRMSLDPEKDEVDVDDFIDAELNTLRIVHCNPAKEDKLVTLDDVLEEGYSEDSKQIAYYLKTLRRPPGMSAKEFRAFKAKALTFVVNARQLYKQASKNIPRRRVVDNEAERDDILQELHDSGGHRGKEGTYKRVADRFWWSNMYEDVKKYVRTCDVCQRRAPNKEEEPLHPTFSSSLWMKVGLDVVKMPPAQGKAYLVLARDDLSGWVEGEALAKANSKRIAKFFWSNIVCRHGMPEMLLNDGGPENKKHLRALVAKYQIKQVLSSAYHPMANGMVERGHQPIVDCLAKLTDGGHGAWPSFLDEVLWADRTTVRASTKHTPFFLQFGRQPILPLDITFATWQVARYHSVQTRPELLKLRTEQILRRDEDLEEAIALCENLRRQNKDIFDSTHRTRGAPFSVGDLVLLHNTKLENTHTGKLEFRWMGPYRIHSINPTGSYRLAELDGAEMEGSVPGRRLKKFSLRNIAIPADQLVQRREETMPTPEPQFNNDDLDELDPDVGRVVQPHEVPRDNVRIVIG